MRVLDTLVDDEGYKHIEVILEPGDSKKKLLAELDLVIVDSIDPRIEQETGFEFFHVKGM